MKKLKRNNIKQNKYNILTFDGGGIKGALSIGLLERIVKNNPDFMDKVSMLGGTSTGSFIALALAYGISVEKIKSLYSYDNAKFIFTPAYSEIVRPKYDNKNLKKILATIFPENLRLKDLKKTVVIPAFFLGSESASWDPIFYTNTPNSPTENAKVIDVALASSAAPITFPTYKGHMDGGIAAMNPSLSCLVHALDDSVGKNLSEINLLSIGTGYSIDSIKSDTKSWGAMEWIINKRPSSPIISILLEGNLRVSEMLSQKLLDERFFRINPHMVKDVAMDDYEAVGYLKTSAQNYDISKCNSWVINNW